MARYGQAGRSVCSKLPLVVETVACLVDGAMTRLGADSIVQDFIYLFVPQLS
jgi:hypothetical protein